MGSSAEKRTCDHLRCACVRERQGNRDRRDGRKTNLSDST